LFFAVDHVISLPSLRADAESKADFSAYAIFYQSIAHLVPGFIPPTERGTVSLEHMSLPPAATDAVAVLSAPGLDYPRNILNLKAFQYWGGVSPAGGLKIGNVADGTYRLTVYAKGRDLPRILALSELECRCLWFIHKGRGGSAGGKDNTFEGIGVEGGECW
jgi:rhamnogalacturonan endolyase